MFELSILFSLIGIILSFVLFLLSDGSSASDLYLLVAIFVFFCLSLCYTSDNYKLKNFWLRPSLICFFSLYIVAFQLCIDHVLGYSDLNSTVFPGASYFSDQCFYSSSIFIFAYIIGVALFNKKLIKKNTHIIFNSQQYARSWLLLMLIFFAFFIFSIDVRLYLSGAIYYGSGAADFISNRSSTFEGIYQILFYITLASYAKLLKDRKDYKANIINYFKGFPLLFWITVIAYILLRLLSGDRGPVIYNTLALVYCFLWYSKHKFRLLTVISVLMIGAITVSFLGYYRSRDPSLGIAEKIIATIERQSEISSNSVVNATKELAESVDTHFYAVRDINIGRTSHSLGKYTFLSITSAIPGLKRQYLWDIGFEPSEIDSAVYFSVSSQGVDYSYSKGSSMFGEAFLEFNLLGMIIYGFILGMIFKYLDYAIIDEQKMSVLNLALVLNLSARAIYMGRTSFGIEMGSVMHMCVIYFLFNLFLRKVFK